MKRIAFDMERAKSITAGREPGRVVNGEGKSVRLLCFDKKSADNWVIVGLVDVYDSYEEPKVFDIKGGCTSGMSYGQLWLEVPEETELKPFANVLVRDSKYDMWKPRILGMLRKGSDGKSTWYETVSGAVYKFCIPYEGNEHLLGTSQDE